VVGGEEANPQDQSNAQNQAWEKVELKKGGQTMGERMIRGGKRKKAKKRKTVTVGGQGLGDPDKYLKRIQN